MQRAPIPLPPPKEMLKWKWIEYTIHYKDYVSYSTCQVNADCRFGSRSTLAGLVHSLTCQGAALEHGQTGQTAGFSPQSNL